MVHLWDPYQSRSFARRLAQMSPFVFRIFTFEEGTLTRAEMAAAGRQTCFVLSDPVLGHQRHGFFFLSVTLFSRALLFLSFGCLRALPTTRREIRLGEQPVGEITAIKGSLPNTPGEDLTFIRTHTCMPQLEPLKPGCSVNAASLRCNGSCATDPERGLPRRDCGSRVLANTRGRYT